MSRILLDAAEPADGRLLRLPDDALCICLKNEPRTEVCIRDALDGANVGFVIRILSVQCGNVEWLVVAPSSAGSRTRVGSVVDGGGNGDVRKTDATERKSEI